MNRRFMLMGACALISACAIVPGENVLAPNSTLVVTRHADREGASPDLSETGRARARALVAAVEELGVKHIYSPGIQRNLETAAPLANALDLPVKRLPQENPVPGLTERSAGTVAIWIGNKGNIRTIWEGLRLSDPAPLAYGDLHIIRSDEMGRVTVERRRYGPE